VRDLSARGPIVGADVELRRVLARVALGVHVLVGGAERARAAASPVSRLPTAAGRHVVRTGLPVLVWSRGVERGRTGGRGSDTLVRHGLRPFPVSRVRMRGVERARRSGGRGPGALVRHGLRSAPVERVRASMRAGVSPRTVRSVRSHACRRVLPRRPPGVRALPVRRRGADLFGALCPNHVVRPRLRRSVSRGRTRIVPGAREEDVRVRPGRERGRGSLFANHRPVCRALWQTTFVPPTPMRTTMSHR
jgi:hypothetical protein